MNCAGCPRVGPSWPNLVPPEGPPDPIFACVGEAPGVQEYTHRRPFVGPSGELLRKTLAAVGVDTLAVYYTNVVKCYAPGNPTPTPREIQACTKGLVEELRRANVKVVVALGNVALEALTGMAGIMKHSGWVIRRDGLTIVPAVHPAAVLRSSALFPNFARILQRVGEGKLELGYAPHEYEVARTVSQANNYLLSLADLSDVPVVVDIETDGYDLFDNRILCVSFCSDDRDAMVIPEEIAYAPGLKATWQTLANSKVKWVGHNLYYDVLRIWTQLGYRFTQWYDTMLAHYLLNENRGTHGLKQLAMEELGAPNWESDIKKYLRKPATDSYRGIPSEVLYEYNASDVIATYRLFNLLEKRLEEYPKLRRLLLLDPEGLMASSEVFVDISRSGILIEPIRRDALAAEQMAVREDAIRYVRWAADDPDLNLNSVQQIAHLLYDVFEAPKYPDSRKSGRAPRGVSPSGHKPPRTTSKEQLELLAEGYEFSDVVQQIMTYRHANTAISTYLKNYVPASDGRIHPSYAQHASVTGRIGTNNPNILNMPHKSDEINEELEHLKGIRGLVVAPPGFDILHVDYSQAELRVCAVLSNSQGLKQIYTQGGDVHDVICRKFYGEHYTKMHRVIAKSIVFGLLYGRGAWSVSQAFGIPMAEADSLFRTLFNMMDGFEAWRERLWKETFARGYVEGPLGRRRRFPLIVPDELNEIKRQIVNAPIQSTSWDLTRISMIRIQRWLPTYNARLLFPIHDALLFETPKCCTLEIARRAKAVMEQVPREILGDEIPFVCDVEMGPSYAEEDLQKVEVT